MKIKKNKKVSKKIIGATLFLTVMVLIAGAVYYRGHRSSNNPEQQVVGGESINYSPPTEEDIQRAEDNKKKIVNNQDTKNAESINSQSQKNTKPIITYAGLYGESVEVGGYVNLYEDNGICTVILTNSGKKIEKSVNATKNVSTTDCPTVSVKSNDLGPGTWIVSLAYKSPQSSGVSDERNIGIQ